jgi:hypothetical protein
MNRFLLATSSDAINKKNRLAPTVKLPFFFKPFSLSILRYVLLIIIILCSFALFAQPTNEADVAAYRKVITERSAKIVNTLGITDSGKYKMVLSLLVDQYAALNDIHEQNKKTVTGIKLQSLSKQDMDGAIKKEDEKKMSQLVQLHGVFVTHLNELLTGEQVEKVKDGMTYSILPITYTAYLDMLPRLTTEQKTQLYAWLKEARELAMDAGSSEKKHEVFGKYKGKINNYLSAAGYDMKKEGEEWQKRIKEREAAKKQQQ